MSERAKFVLEYERRWQDGFGRANVAELCRMFGVSRETGYVWIRRFVAAGHDVAAIADRSRRPHTSPTAVGDDMQDFIVEMRKQKPKWGPRMLRAWLVDRHPSREFPSASTFAAILKRNGLTSRKSRRRRAKGPVLPSAPLGEPASPNSVWCLDFKGQFRTRDGELCYPLTLVDAFSRYCLRCEACVEPTYDFTRSVLDSAFREFGLPAAIRSDNGSPFAGNGPAGLSQLAVWLLRLGVRLERITPGKPQQNGRQERFHRTLKDATASPPNADLRLQQRGFNHFRLEYNNERPHSALGMKPPASRYSRSTRRYPRALLSRSDGDFTQQLQVDRMGAIRWRRGQRVFVSSALAHERIAAHPDGDMRWALFFGDIRLGHFDEAKPLAGFVPATRPRQAHILEYVRSSDASPMEEGLRRVQVFVTG